MTNSIGTVPAAGNARLTADFDRHGAAFLDDLLAQDCVLHTTGPAPSGGPMIGCEACRKHWGALIAEESVQFVLENEFDMGRTVGRRTVVQQWRSLDQHDELMQRGVNIFTVHGGLISSAHGCVKAGA
jgi:ketosteroid isomerase-like protein